MSDIEVTVAEEGTTYVFPDQDAVDAWSLHGVPAYIRTRASTSGDVDGAVDALDAMLQGGEES